MPTYTIYPAAIGTTQGWLGTLNPQWIVVGTPTASQLVLRNIDGSHTVLSGINFAYNPSTGAITGGTVTGTQYTDSSGNTLYEDLTGLSKSLKTLHDELTFNGFTDTCPWADLLPYGDFTPVVPPTTTQIRLFNSDSLTYTYINGTGFKFDATTGRPTAGTITSIAHYANDGTTQIGSPVTEPNLGLVATINYLLDPTKPAKLDLMSGNDTFNNQIANAAGYTVEWALAGNDTVHGNIGTDVIYDSGGNDSFDGGGGNDTVDYSLVTSTAAATIRLDLGTVTGTGTGTDALTGIENVVGTRGNDTIYGSSAVNSINGFEGNDTIFGSAGDDNLSGGNGTDTISYALFNSGVVVDLLGGGASDTGGVVIGSDTLGLFENAIGSGGNDFIYGDTKANRLDGGAGDDYLDGDQGADTLVGGLGNDTYALNDADTITEAATQGTDTVLSTLASYTLAANVENLTLNGSSNINGTGNGLANLLVGNSGDNLIDGAGGIDTIDYSGVTTANLTINLTAGGGYDDQSGAVIGHDTLKNIENVFGSAGNDTITGSAVANVIEGRAGTDTIYGLAGNDIIDGGAGSDQMDGGAGNDTYYIDDLWDHAIEASGGGTDLVISSVSYTLEANVENLTLTGGGNSYGAGNGLDNIITGNSGGNSLYGDDGADTLAGGLGDDFYLVDNKGGKVDKLIEAANAGTDTVWTYVSWTLGANIENLAIMIGAGDINATGNELGNLMYGNDGANILDGKAGVDQMYGGAGDDTYYVDNLSDYVQELSASDGTDKVISSVTFTLGQYVDNLTLTGAANIDGTGNAGNNVIIGNSGKNTLLGGDGDDTLDGGAGIDTVDYSTASGAVTFDLTITSQQDTIGAGKDTLLNIENVIGSAFADVITGTAAANVLDGRGGQDNLHGLAGNDILYGDGSADFLYGGLGNDTYHVVDYNDQVLENANEGIDAVFSAGTFTLDVNVENLTLTGGANVNATGNSLKNILTGNSGDNRLDGKGGGDTLIGGDGDDTYVVYSTADKLVETATGGAYDYVLSNVSWTLATNFEALELAWFGGNINGTGNSVNNLVDGNPSDNILDGKAGADQMGGGDGNDTYYVDNDNDLVIESSDPLAGGTDKVFSTVSFTLPTYVENLTLLGTADIDGTGNTKDNIIIGNSGKNTLIGGDGDDTLDGGAGIDTVDYLSATSGVTVDLSSTAQQDTGGAGKDTLLNIENVTGTLHADTITGNAGNNYLDGYAGGDIIYGLGGNDTLAGGTGSDLEGGTGNDTYIVYNTGVTIVEAVNAGIDSVRSYVSYTLTANVENLTLEELAGNSDATGNSLANTLTANTYDNVLDGGTGVDQMYGGLGNDTYYVDNIGDKVFETNGVGVDLVYSSVNFTLGSYVEKLTLQMGAGNINGTGNSLANTIVGNDGNNTLRGGGGDDTIAGGAGDDKLYGEAGSDIFKFDWGAVGNDTIYGWEDKATGSQDMIELSGFAINWAQFIADPNTSISDSAAGLVISITGGTITLAGIHDVASLDASDFQFS
jgi:Ca2+-binding RTX toxin-like protein